MRFVKFKAMGGVSYIRAEQVIAVTSNDPTKSNVFVIGSANSIPIAEAPEDIVRKIEEAASAAKAHGAPRASE